MLRGHLARISWVTCDLHLKGRTTQDDQGTQTQDVQLFIFTRVPGSCLQHGTLEDFAACIVEEEGTNQSRLPE